MTMAEAQEDQPGSKDFEDAIAALDKIDPRAPAALASRLEYADFLAGSASGDCQQRLANAESLLAMIAANPALEVTLPSGRARAANIEYRIHLARASCGSSPPDRETELRKALAAAQRAVDLYRDALDYQSMAIAQFDAGVTYRMLGDDGAAVASLETAIEMDREYGFRRDAEDNYKLLMRWKGNDTVAAATAAADPAASVMQDFPSRSAALKFGWIANDTDVGIQMDYTRAAADKINRAVGTGLVKRHLRERYGRWVASYEPNKTANDADVRPNGAADLDKLATIFTRALRQHPDIEVSNTGDLQEVVDSGKVSRRLSAAAQALIRERAPAAKIAARSSRHAAYEIDIAFAPEVIEATTAENYSLETGAWIGATLEQGVWYKMSAALTMPGIEQLLFPYDVEFAYTHNVPCTAGSTIRSCVELVIHATPQEDVLKEFLKQVPRQLHLRHGQAMHYWSTTYLRIVTDPNTLMTYASESRRYWYLSTDADPRGAENVSERIVSTFAYY
jgi:tetratricopeptide (TPR) repeat protein